MRPLDPESRLGSVQDLEAYRRQTVAARSGIMRQVRVCIGTGCTAKGSRKVFERFREAVSQGEPALVVEAKCTGCHGFCERGPVVMVDPGNVFYENVREEDVPEIWRETVVAGRPVKRLLYKDERTGAVATTPEEVPFYRAQHRIVLALNGVIDPVSIEDYIAAGGYAALAKALTAMPPEDIIAEITRSGLRGRGGGGFLTGRKWRSASEAHGDPKYVIANGDEGDPGAFMDRSLMEGTPHAVIEGMIIGGYAIGSSHGYIYVRNEYPMAVEHLTIAIRRARELGLLGQNILGTTHSFDIRINRGAGAFVCGESTALMASLEGRIGEPRAKYVHTVEAGVWGRPSLLNNVETWANVPLIINNGAAWYARIGTPTNTGTKIFSLVGNVEHTGLVEVPMGTTLREIVYKIGGGIKQGRKFKAVQTGGPSGGCIPEQHLDTPIDFDALTALGSMMGSGGMIVMDEGSCMVDVASYYVEFLKEESCGKCIPCREGVSEMVTILNRIKEGQGQPGDLAFLEDIAVLLSEAALCGLGTSAASPVLSTIKYFRDEYESHIRHKECGARVCKALISFYIDQTCCKRCLLCVKQCPAGAIRGDKNTPVNVIQDKCVRCGVCLDVCPGKFRAVRIVSPRTDLPVSVTAG